MVRAEPLLLAAVSVRGGRLYFFCLSMDGNPVKVEDAAPIYAETQVVVVAAGWAQVDAVGMW